MTLKVHDFCPPLDAMTLLEFRDDAFQAWVESPDHQNENWFGYYRRVARLLDHSRALKEQIRLSLG
ncbi:MAG: hypothetical protein JO111_16320 [Caulobacteraceae bacterium]|nr:hypothetical protein [Caulobacteraceae bacterium]